MEIDLSALTPSPTNWFSPFVEYEGKGHVEFADPSGIAEGPAKVKFDQYGGGTVELQIEEFSCDRELHFGLFELLSGGKPVQEQIGVSMGFGGLNNWCTKLTIATDEGIFTAHGKIHYSLHDHHIFSDKGTLELYPLRSQFIATTHGSAVYWVIPLTNFVSE